MAQSLDEFVKEVEEQLVRFEAWWLKQHKENPEMFPLEIEDGDEGLWWESFETFEE